MWRGQRQKALFIEGDFWHGWGYRARKDRLPEFWRNKIEATCGATGRTTARSNGRLGTAPDLGT